MNSKYLLPTVIAVTFTLASTANAQPTLERDWSSLMEIPSIITVESSPAHLYVLSDTEGMIVFRTHPNSVQWLYSSTGMEQRGNTITSDIRFAYLFGNSRRLTVLEPTSVLGVYSSTLLPATPIDAGRIDQDLYIALGPKGVGSVSLRTPVSVDSTVDLLEEPRLKDEHIADLESSSDQLFLLSRDHKIFIFGKSEQGITLENELQPDRSLNRLFLVEKRLMGTDRDGNIFEISTEGKLSMLGSIGEPVEKIEAWKEWSIIKGRSQRIWTSYQHRSPTLWKDDREAGNHFTVTKGQLWLSEYNKLSTIIATEEQLEPAEEKKTVSSRLKIKPIQNQIIPYPKPLLLAIELQDDVPSEQVQFAYQSDVTNAKIRGSGFYWQPTENQIGTHQFKIIATGKEGERDSTRFSVEVESFNAPPNFVPVRPMTIPVGESFTLPLKALDRDGMNQNLIRYLGVDLPEGASIDEQTGEFIWTPTQRQVGKNTFRVIATDQYGAATSVTVSITVVEVARDDSGNNGN